MKALCSERQNNVFAEQGAVGVGVCHCLGADTENIERLTITTIVMLKVGCFVVTCVTTEHRATYELILSTNNKTSE